ncbi:hypothetical protein LJC31_05870 [Synergistaceae bacterium OttesenSCG-928-I11]|nr:hypothetical protein [Synergistaceae bacterium OttesenSCG-928-I11]
MKCFKAGKEFFWQGWMIFFAAVLLLVAALPSAATAAYRSSKYSIDDDGGAVTYDDTSNLYTALPRAVKLNKNHVLVIFTGVELEVATNAAGRGAAAGVALAAQYTIPKFSFSKKEKIASVIPHVFSANDKFRTFSVFEIVTSGDLMDKTTLSYKPSPTTADSYVLAVPKEKKLLGAFNGITLVDAVDKLKDLELGDAIQSDQDGKILVGGENPGGAPLLDKEAHALFEVEVLDDKSQTTVAFTPDNLGTQWSTNFNGTKNMGTGTGSGTINLAAGSNRAEITLGTGNAAVPYTIFIRRTDGTTPKLEALTVTASGGQKKIIQLEAGQMAYYASFPTETTSVTVVPEAAAGVGIKVGGEVVQSGKGKTITIVAGETEIPIKLEQTDTSTGTTSEAHYTLFVQRGNEAVLYDLKLLMTYNGQTTEVPIYHFSTSTPGFQPNAFTNTDGWHYYSISPAITGDINIKNATFHLLATFNDETRSYVSTAIKNSEAPDDRIQSGFMTKGFTVDRGGADTTLYLTMYRDQIYPGNLKGNPQLEIKVAVHITTSAANPKLSMLTVTDGFTGEKLLDHPNTEMPPDTQQKLTTSRYAKNFTINAAVNDGAFLLENDFGATVKDGTLSGNIAFDGHGEKKELTLTVTNVFYPDKKTTYRLDVTQGYDGEPHIILGMAPEAVLGYIPDSLSFGINEMTGYRTYNAAKNTWELHSFVGKVPELPSRRDNNTGNTILTVNWAVFPPLAQAAEFNVTDYKNDTRPSACWSIQNITRNASNTGGTLELVLSAADSDKSQYQYKTYMDETSAYLQTVILNGNLFSGRAGERIATRSGTFAKVENYEGFPEEIEIQDIIKKPVVIDLYPEENRLPLQDFTLWGSNGETVSSIGLQVGMTYKIPISYTGITTYGAYRRAVEKEPELGLQYPTVMMRNSKGDLVSIKDELEVMMRLGASENSMDGTEIDFSHDPIIISLGRIVDGKNTEDYVEINQEARTIKLLKEFPDGTFVKVYARTKRLVLVRAVTIHSISSKLTIKEYNNEKRGIAYIAISPQLTFYGFKGAKALNTDEKEYFAKALGGLAISTGDQSYIGVYNLKEESMSAKTGTNPFRWNIYEEKGKPGDAVRAINGGEDWTNRKSSFINHYGLTRMYGIMYGPVGPFYQTFYDRMKEQGVSQEVLDRYYETFLRAPKIDTYSSLAGPYVLRIKGNLKANHNIEIGTHLTVICSEEDAEDMKDSSQAFASLAQASGRRSPEEEDAGELDFTHYEYVESPSEDAFLLHNGQTAYSMACSFGSTNESAARTAANEIEWAVPVIYGAQNMYVYDGEGNLISSDYSLFLDEAMKPSEEGTDTARAEAEFNGMFRLDFTVPTSALHNVEFSDFFVKRKGDDTIYNIKPNGSGDNGGILLHPKYAETESSQGGGGDVGCNAGLVGLLALLALTGTVLRRRH